MCCTERERGRLAHPGREIGSGPASKTPDSSRVSPLPPVTSPATKPANIPAMNFLRRSQPLLRLLSRPAAASIPKPKPPPAAALARRPYYSSPAPYQPFRRRGQPHWYRNPRVVLAVTFVSGGVILTVLYGSRETVPYTKRTHFVLLSHSAERKLGESQFDQLKDQLRPKILPPIHPETIRVRIISKQIISALQRGLRHDEPRWTDTSYADTDTDDYGVPHAPPVLSLGEEEGRWGEEDDVLDDNWVRRSRQAGEMRQAEPATQHLVGLNWEVLVVDDPMVNAFCLPGGKIVVFTGLLDHFRADAEIATVIAHEVGHAIARHAAETITKNLWLTLLQLIVVQFFYMPDLVNAMSTLLLKLPFSRKMEMEADYIGLLLLASAGYDPRVAPHVYEKLGQITGDSALKDYLSTHPSSKKRALVLSQAKVMDEALDIYREVIAGRGVEGFL